MFSKTSVFCDLKLCMGMGGQNIEKNYALKNIHIHMDEPESLSLSPSGLYIS